MSIKLLSAVAVSALAFAPAVAFGDNVAASLSASFGTSPSGVTTADIGGSTVTLVTPQSLSVAAAAGDRVVAGSAATPFSSGAAAGAGSATDGVAPYASVTNEGGAYEVNVAFAEPGLFAALADLEQNLQAQITANADDIAGLNTALANLTTQVNTNSSDIDAIQTALNDVCSLVALDFNGDSGTVEVSSTGTAVTGFVAGTISILGVSIPVPTPVNSTIVSTGAFTPTGDIICNPV